jgi:hypothetical protein
VKPTFVLSLIQERSYVIMLGQWRLVLPILIAFTLGVVWLILRASSRKQR